MCIRSIIIYSFWRKKNNNNKYFFLPLTHSPFHINNHFTLDTGEEIFFSCLIEKKKTLTSVFIVVHPFIIILALRKLLLLCISLLGGKEEEKLSERHKRFHTDNIHTHIFWVHHTFFFTNSPICSRSPSVYYF